MRLDVWERWRQVILSLASMIVTLLTTSYAQSYIPYDDPYPHNPSDTYPSGGTFHGYGKDDGSHKPKFIPIDNNVTVSPGDRAVIRCRVENLGTKQLTWKRVGELQPLTIGLFVYYQDPRYSVDYNQRLNEWNFIINDVRPEDEGKYQCLISTRDNIQNYYDVTLNVRTVQINGSDFVERGDTILLICKATGKPDPPQDVEWFKDDKLIMSDASGGVMINKRLDSKVLYSELMIRDSQDTDHGNYECISSNKDSASLFVNVVTSVSNKKRGTQKHSGNAAGSQLNLSTSIHTPKLSLFLLMVGYSTVMSLIWIT